MSFELTHGNGNPRNSEGSFVKLNDGRIMLAYTKYSGGSDNWGDHCSADIAAVYSSDEGKNWGNARILVKNSALNVMSVTLLRLQDGRIALVYCVKSAVPNSHAVDCRPKICFSSDETETWTEPVEIVQVPPSYFVMNNDRMIQLKSGRLLIPLSYHRYLPGHDAYGLGCGIAIYYISDDGGATWRQSMECVYPPQNLADGFQEPGIVELSDGSVMSWFRTNGGCQYKTFSRDGGETWTVPVPATEFLSPQGPPSPLSMKRDPETGILYAIWNDWHPRNSVACLPESWGRTPLVIARSCDEGKTWVDHTVLENQPDHGYCYIAMLFLGKKLLLEYCCGGGKGVGVLQDSRVRIFDLAGMGKKK